MVDGVKQREYSTQPVDAGHYAHRKTGKKQNNEREKNKDWRVRVAKGVCVVRVLGLSPSTASSADWCQEWLKKRGPSVFPIDLQTVLGDVLELSPSTVGSLDWFQE